LDITSEDIAKNCKEFHMKITTNSFDWCLKFSNSSVKGLNWYFAIYLWSKLNVPNFQANCDAEYPIVWYFFFYKLLLFFINLKCKETFILANKNVLIFTILMSFFTHIFDCGPFHLPVIFNLYRRFTWLTVPWLEKYS